MKSFAEVIEGHLADAQATMLVRHRSSDAIQLKKSVHEAVDSFLKHGSWQVFQLTITTLMGGIINEE